MVINGGKSYKEAAAAVGISKSTLIRAVRAWRIDKKGSYKNQTK